MFAIAEVVTLAAPRRSIRRDRPIHTRMRLARLGVQHVGPMSAGC